MSEILLFETSSDKQGKSLAAFSNCKAIVFSVANSRSASGSLVSFEEATTLCEAITAHIIKEKARIAAEVAKARYDNGE